MVTRPARYGSPAVRAAARGGQILTSTAPLAPDYPQANLVVLPRALAYDFLVFAQRNPRPCPVLLERCSSAVIRFHAVSRRSRNKWLPLPAPSVESCLIRVLDLGAKPERRVVWGGGRPYG